MLSSWPSIIAILRLSYPFAPNLVSYFYHSSSIHPKDYTDRLEYYFEVFQNTSFELEYFKWCYSRGCIEKLLEQPPSLDEKLKEFLEPHTRLSWLHSIKMNDFRGCSQTTAALAIEETEDVAQKKILLSIQKLSLLATNGEALPAGTKIYILSLPYLESTVDADTLEQHRQLIMYQEHLGDFISLKGIDVRKTMTASELISAVLTLGTAVKAKNFVFAFDIFTNTNLVCNDLKCFLFTFNS